MKGKLFSLKEWLTVADAAKHLSIVFGENVTEADVLRLALDGRLQLSVNLVNHAKARCGKVISWEETEWWLFPEWQSLSGQRRLMDAYTEKADGRPCPQKLEALFNEIPVDEREKYCPLMRSLNLDGERFLTLSETVSTLVGVWDLPMIGAERLDVEHEYQFLTGGPAVTLMNLDGAFVAGRNEQMCQIQERWDDNEYESGSNAALEKLKRKITEEHITEEEKKKLLDRYNEQRKQFHERKNARPDHENYYPAGGLPTDAVIVVRTEALREFEQSITGGPIGTEDLMTKDGARSPSPGRSHVSDRLAVLNQAAQRWWANADPGDPTTHEENATVAAWLEERGFSSTLASKAATIIRPDWAHTGRKPDK